MEGIIIKNISNDYTVKTEKGIFICKPRGKFRLEGKTPLVGDKVIIDDINSYILEIKPRKNELVRPPISNIDNAIIVTSVKEPDFNSALLDKLLTIISYNNIHPIICLTKLDLLSNEEKRKIDSIANYYKSIGYQVVDNSRKKELYDIFKNKISVFTGQSGAGKSTLLNMLDISLSLKTNEISKALGRGKHTTRCTTLYQINDGLVADTPGFSAVDLNNMTKIQIRDNMKEMFDNLEFCKYRDCMHINEDDCQVKKMVEENKILLSRYENYKSFIKGK